MSPLDRVTELAKAANVKIYETYNAPDVLPFTSEALDLVRANPELRSEFEEAFLNMSGYAPSEFVEICMHALRWSKVKQCFEELHRAAIARNDWRAEPVYRHYLEAFEDDWDGAQTYAEYFGSGTGR